MMKDARPFGILGNSFAFISLVSLLNIPFVTLVCSGRSDKLSAHLALDTITYIHIIQHRISDNRDHLPDLRGLPRFPNARFCQSKAASRLNRYR